MDMKEIFENGCFSPAWAEDEMEHRVSAGLRRKDLDVLLEELAEIKNNIENLEAKSWYLDRLRQYHEHGFSNT